MTLLALLGLMRAEADRDGVVTVRVVDLAGTLGYSERQIQRLLRSLKESGKVLPLSSSGGRGRATRYQLLETPRRKGDIDVTLSEVHKKGDINVALLLAQQAREEAEKPCISGPAAAAGQPVKGDTDVTLSEDGQAPLFPPHPPIPRSISSPSSPPPPVVPAAAGAARAAGGGKPNKLPPQNRFVASVYAVYRGAGVEGPPPSAVGQWARKIGEQPLLELLEELASQGHLAAAERPQAYVHRAVANVVEGKRRQAAAGPGDERRIGQAARFKAAKTVRGRQGDDAA